MTERKNTQEEQAQVVGEWERSHRIPEVKRLTYWYSDYGIFIEKFPESPELLTRRYEEVMAALIGTAEKRRESEKEQPGAAGVKEGNMADRLPSKETVERLRERYPAGTRIELVSMEDPYSKLKPGDRGSVTFIDDTGTIFADWDSGSGLGLVYGIDSCRRIEN